MFIYITLYEIVIYLISGTEIDKMQRSLLCLLFIYSIKLVELRRFFNYYVLFLIKSSQDENGSKLKVSQVIICLGA